ncbi:DUF4123 domain-containing protein [Thioclava sp. GXIMD4215]|uniref:DUF4123 domain-containing protein n=1 Tax=Thioclava sp. GXIMD4215 TaxID=3131928 RepID=UPI00311B0C4F
MDNDFWEQIQQPSIQIAPNTAVTKHLEVVPISYFSPLDQQFGRLPKKAVPEQVESHLFGELDFTGSTTSEIDRSCLKTFSILDAAKVRNLPEILEASGLEHRCLFTGNAARELANVAPYAVALTEDSEFTRRLFTDSGQPTDLWACEPGIFIRSCIELDAFCQHFRKFTRVRDIQGNWFYFRFWERRSLFHYLSGISKKTDIAKYWAHTGSGNKLHYILSDGSNWARFSGWDRRDEVISYSQFRITQMEIDLFTSYRKKAFINKLKAYLLAETRDVRLHNTEFVSHLCDIAKENGYTIEQAVADFSVAYLYAGNYVLPRGSAHADENVKIHQLDRARSMKKWAVSNIKTLKST